MSLHRWEWLLDVVALVAFIVAAVTIIADRTWWTSPGLVVAAAAVIGRRRVPVWAAMGAVVASGVVLFTPNIAFPTWVLAEVVLFTLAIRAPKTWTLVLAAVHALVLYAGAIVVFDERPWEPVALILPVWTAAVVAFGMALRSNDDYVRALEAQAQSAVAFRESEVARHVGEERLRIARDLHDSVAHSVSVISLHAGSAERHLEKDPERVTASLRQIRASSREVVDELQEILTLLRDPLGSSETEEVPGPAALDSLVATARRAGLHVQQTLEPLPSLDRSVGVAVYRILQESFTNALKHGAGDVVVSVRAKGNMVHIDVNNAVAHGGAQGSGFGIVGMTERAASVHGTLEAVHKGGRFEVTAQLPMHLHSHEGEY